MNLSIDAPIVTVGVIQSYSVLIEMAKKNLIAKAIEDPLMSLVACSTIILMIIRGVYIIWQMYKGK